MSEPHFAICEPGCPFCELEKVARERDAFRQERDALARLVETLEAENTRAWMEIENLRRDLQK